MKDQTGQMQMKPLVLGCIPMAQKRTSSSASGRILQYSRQKYIILRHVQQRLHRGHKKSKHINSRQFECNTAQEITGKGMQTEHIFAGYVI
jgi:hypothetical protein